MTVLALALSTQVLDLVSFLYAVPVVGIGMEANPMAAHLYAISPWAVVAYKACLAVLLSVGALRVRLAHRRLGRTAYGIVMGLGLLGLLANLSVLA